MPRNDDEARPDPCLPQKLLEPPTGSAAISVEEERTTAWTHDIAVLHTGQTAFVISH